MPQFGWDSCPASPRRQVGACLARWQALLNDALVGVYLHGSLAMGCWNPARSDIDLLVIVGEPMAVEAKRELVAGLLALSGQPHPVEISFLAQSDFRPWRYPTPYDLHYSEEWRERYAAALRDGSWRSWNDERGLDPDLAAHITVTRARGVRLYGPPAAEAFPPVPPSDYVNSLLADIAWAREMMPRHADYVLLNLCRIAAYLQEGGIRSKDEGGEWALAHVAPRWHDVIRWALARYRGAPGLDVTPADAEAFAACMRAEIVAAAQVRVEG